MDPTLRAIRRYPVKAMAGESLPAVELDARGLAGDRWYAVVDAEGRLASLKDSRRFRRRDGVVGFAASTGADGRVRVTGGGGAWPVCDAGLDAALSAVLDGPVAVRAEGGVLHQDGGPVSLVGTATLRWCAERWGVDADPRRLRVNLLLETDEPFVEESWVGRTVALGSVELEIRERVTRCRTVDLPQDGVPGTTRWLAPLGAERDLCLAVYAEVRRPGTVRLGDRVVIPPGAPAGARAAGAGRP